MSQLWIAKGANGPDRRHIRRSVHAGAELIDELSSVLNCYLETDTLVVPLLREIHSDSVRAVLGCSFTHLC